MTSFRLKYVHQFIDHNGHPRFYFRRHGKRVALPGSPWSAEFMEAYQRAMSLKPVLQHIGSDRVKPRSIHALAIAYYDSAAFRALKPITQGVYRNIIERFCRETDGDGLHETFTRRFTKVLALCG